MKEVEEQLRIPPVDFGFLKGLRQEELQKEGCFKFMVRAGIQLPFACKKYISYEVFSEEGYSKLTVKGKLVKQSDESFLRLVCQHLQFEEEAYFILPGTMLNDPESKYCFVKADYDHYEVSRQHPNDLPGKAKHAEVLKSSGNFLFGRKLYGRAFESYRDALKELVLVQDQKQLRAACILNLMQAALLSRQQTNLQHTKDFLFELRDKDEFKELGVADNQKFLFRMGKLLSALRYYTDSLCYFKQALAKGVLESRQFIAQLEGRLGKSQSQLYSKVIAQLPEEDSEEVVRLRRLRQKDLEQLHPHSFDSDDDSLGEAPEKEPGLREN